MQGYEQQQVVGYPRPTVHQFLGQRDLALGLHLDIPYTGHNAVQQAGVSGCVCVCVYFPTLGIMQYNKQVCLGVCVCVCNYKWEWHF